MKNLRVSVIIPCFNSEKTIIKTISSVLHGTCLPYEILVYDDNSSDDTVKVIEESFGSSSLIKIFKGNSNKGAGNARNELLKRAKGDYIAFLDSDDFWYEQKLEKQVLEVLTGDYDIVTCGYDIFDEGGLLIGSRLPLKNINFYSMHLTNWLPTSMTIFRKTLKDADEMPSIRRRQDYGFWLKVFKKNKNLKCHVIHEPLGGYLRRADSLSSGKIDNVKFNFRMFRDVLGYNQSFSFLFVLLNALVRIMRP